MSTSCFWRAGKLLLGIAMGGWLGIHGAFAQSTPSVCSPSLPAPVSGSTGVHGVLDSANTNAALGLAWPVNAAEAVINIDTGGVTFLDAGDNVIGTDTLFGTVSTPILPEGKLHFTWVRLENGKGVDFTTASTAPMPPIRMLSCEDIVLEVGSQVGVNMAPPRGPIAGAAFMGGDSSTQVGVAFEGFGPRVFGVDEPAGGSLHPHWGGGGGKGSPASSGPPVTPGHMGGSGGPALFFASSQRIRVDGLIDAAGKDAQIGALTAAQGGGGGAVILSSLIAEGVGEIRTLGGLDSDGVRRSPSGPIGIYSSVSNLFTGIASTTPVSGNPVTPAPTNLPQIDVSFVSVSSLSFFQSGFPNTGSLTVPDVTLPQVSAPVNVFIQVNANNVPAQTRLTFRAVGTDGSVRQTGSVALDCSEGCIASTTLGLNPGATYQLVVTTDSSFQLARFNANPLPASHVPVLAEWKRRFADGAAELANGMEPPEIPLTERWARVFASRPPIHR